MNNDFYELRVAAIKPETNNAVSISFELPKAVQTHFSYIQGQYITLEVEQNGQKLRRAYSMSSSPREDRLTITVKKVENGRVSAYLCHQLKVGDLMRVMPPEGRFFKPLSIAHHKTYYLIGAGSGITPLFSILKTVLEEEPKSVVHLLYSNRDEESIIFKDDLDRITKHYEGQITVTHILSRPKEVKSGGVFGFLKKANTTWTGWKGRIDAAVLTKWLNEKPQHTAEAEYFICGPLALTQLLETYFVNKGIERKYIHKELFLTSDGDNSANKAHLTGGKKVVNITLNAQKASVLVAEGETVLGALLDAGYNAPFSCRSGACSTCIAKVTDGAVKMDNCFALSEEEIKQGYILACQAHPTTDEVTLNFDV